MTTRRTVILVLGAHRSGTSALAGSLTKLGARAPSQMLIPSPVNPRGFYESAAIVRLHDALFSCVGTHWDDWGGFPSERLSPAQRGAFIQQARVVLDRQYHDAPLCVLKDPRICRFVPLWLSVFQEWHSQVVALLVHRNPYEVAASLAKRDNISLQTALLIWLRHVLDAESGSRSLPRAFVSYDQLLANWRAVLGPLPKQLSLSTWNWDLDSIGHPIDDFLSRDLRHWNTRTAPAIEASELTENVWKLYQIMEDWSKTSEKTKDFSVLDRMHRYLAAFPKSRAPITSTQRF